MDEAESLRELASRCRLLAWSTHHEATAETLLDMAREFEASADAAERTPLIAAPAEPDEDEEAWPADEPAREDHH